MALGLRHRRGLEGTLTTRTYGILAGVAEALGELAGEPAVEGQVAHQHGRVGTRRQAGGDDLGVLARRDRGEFGRHRGLLGLRQGHGHFGQGARQLGRGHGEAAGDRHQCRGHALPGGGQLDPHFVRARRAIDQRQEGRRAVEHGEAGFDPIVAHGHLAAVDAIGHRHRRRYTRPP